MGCRYTLSPLGAKNGSFSSGLDAVIASERTTQMLTPSLRRVYRHPTFYEIPDGVPHI